MRSTHVNRKNSSLLDHRSSRRTRLTRPDEAYAGRAASDVLVALGITGDLANEMTFDRSTGSSAAAVIGPDHVITFLEDLYIPGEPTLLNAGDVAGTQPRSKVVETEIRP